MKKEAFSRPQLTKRKNREWEDVCNEKNEVKSTHLVCKEGNNREEVIGKRKKVKLDFEVTRDRTTSIGNCKYFGGGKNSTKTFDAIPYSQGRKKNANDWDRNS